MDYSDFRIGLEFWCSGRQWRCTDIGTRTVIGICIDAPEIIKRNDAVLTKRKLSRAEAESEGWFDGPPYAVFEHVFDERILVACTLAEPGGA